MKAVEMMKRAINDSDLNGFKWTADKKGLHWSYGVDFDLEIDPCEPDSTVVKLVDNNSGIEAIVIVVPESDAWLVDNYHDFDTDINSAIYHAARRAIVTANHMY